MITRLATWWLRQRGWEVERPHPVSLAVSGNALVLREDDEGLRWSVNFQVEPYITAKRGSLVCTTNRAFQAWAAAKLVCKRTEPGS